MTATTCTSASALIRPSSRERILEAATQLFAAHGFEYTSTLSIARAASISETQTQLLKNFTNKQGLLEAVFAQALERMSALLQEARQLSSPRDQLRRFFVCSLSLAEK